VESCRLGFRASRIFSMKNILVTGADGFLGKYLLRNAKRRASLIAGVRRIPDAQSEFKYRVFNLDQEVTWLPALQDVDIVIHFAVLQRSKFGDFTYDSSRIRQINTLLTYKWMNTCLRAGVKQVVWFSSTKALNPLINSAKGGFYSRSKAELEFWISEYLDRDLSARVTMVRLPPVYGHGVKGKLRFLEQAVKLKFPLIIPQRRQLFPVLSIHNLTDFLFFMIDEDYFPDAIALCDENEVSIDEFCSAIAAAFGLDVPRLIRTKALNNLRIVDPQIYEQYRSECWKIGHRQIFGSFKLRHNVRSTYEAG
jgi:nucleoside-diphosphate-sugar epimerase